MHLHWKLIIQSKTPCQGNEDLIIVHDALGYGDCRLSLAVNFPFFYLKSTSTFEADLHIVFTVHNISFFFSFQIPNHGIFESINSLRELSQMPQWTASKPLRIATGFTHV